MSVTFGFINYQSYQDKALLTCTRGHHQGWAGCFVLGLWIWEKSVSNCRAVVMQGHQKQHFWGNKQFACFLVDIIFNRMKNASSNLLKQKRLSALCSWRMWWNLKPLFPHISHYYFWFCGLITKQYSCISCNYWAQAKRGCEFNFACIVGWSFLWA